MLVWMKVRLNDFYGKTEMRQLTQLRRYLLVSVFLLAAPLSIQSIHAQDEPVLGIEVEQLKQEVIEINKELGVLEEQLLFPANTQVSVFLSMNVGEFFQLDAVSLKINDKQVANYLYTEKQVDALMRGGIQRLHVGNVGKGKHELLPAAVRKAEIFVAASVMNLSKLRT